MSSISCGDIMVPNIEKDYILLLGVVVYIRNVILLGSTTKKIQIFSQRREGQLVLLAQFQEGMEYLTRRDFAKALALESFWCSSISYEGS